MTVGAALAFLVVLAWFIASSLYRSQFFVLSKADEASEVCLFGSLFLSCVCTVFGGIVWACGAAKAGPANPMHVWLAGCIMTSLGLAGWPVGLAIHIGLVSTGKAPEKNVKDEGLVFLVAPVLPLSLYCIVIGGIVWGCGLTKPWPHQGIDAEDEADMAKSTQEAGFILVVAGSSATLMYLVFLVIFKNGFNMYVKVQDLERPDDLVIMLLTMYSALFILIGGVTWACGAAKAGPSNQMYTWLAGCVLTSLGLVMLPVYLLSFPIFGIIQGDEF
eukprot:CAMPEP_0119520236 /NCGR_PEP_ID=MMETSP1344-20130328/36300_1 /TAXON_ID=236787 /ORGANISM="Florenciella parvula, Strain CCMP2471" /LENGTH=273 /DNA_ID=CAMNT_0007558101 /DNA_START=193 /DNA_END=1014 /DNA_ORIENTATION=+